MKIYINGLDHMTNMAVMPIYGKKLKRIFSRTNRPLDFETWYVALSMQVLPRLFKLCPWFDLDLFYGNVKFGWLVGCFGLNGPLRQYFSLYRPVFQREGERGEK